MQMKQLSNAWFLNPLVLKTFQDLITTLLVRFK